MRAFSRLLWRPSQPDLTAPFISRHRLDLKRNTGQLEGLFCDLPERPQDIHQQYLRREERWIVPPSYRTGMAFFVSVMMISLLSLSFLDAEGQAESRQSFLSAQLLESVTTLTEEKENYTSGEELSPAPYLLTNRDAIAQDTDPVRSLLQSDEINEHEELVRWNSSLSKGFKAFDRFLEHWTGITDQAILPQMNWMHTAAQQALKAWSQVISRVQVVGLFSFDREKQEALQDSLDVVLELSDVLKSYDQSYDHLIKALGQDEPQRILVFIQDSYQQRASGGALSAAVELLLENGEILAWRPFHAEEYDDQLRIDLQPPLSMKAITDRWDLQTSNAYVDAERSAEQLHWFWQREARSSADLIVMISSEALERVFSHPMTIETLNEEERSQIESFALRWSALLAINDREGTKALANLVLHAFTDLLDQPELMIQLHPLIKKQFASQQVLVYSSNPEQQVLFREQQVSGALPSLEAQEDALMISTLNQTEEMTDRWREDEVELHTSISEEGTIKHWLHLKRTHTNSSETFAADIDSVLVRNIRRQAHQSLMNILVPKGSELLSIEGVDRDDVQISDFEGFTSWVFPFVTGSGSVSELAISYTLPWTFDTSSVDNYRLHLLKQPGSKSMGFRHHMKLPAELSIFQQLPQEALTVLDRSQVMAVVAGRNP